MKLLPACALGLVVAVAQQTPVFRTGVDLVALDVTVVDRDGRPVVGLTRQDFTVTLNGQPGVIRQLDYLTYGGPPPVEVTASGRETSNTAPAAGQASRGGRVVVLLIDDLSARAGEAQGLVAAAERMLATLDLGDLVGLTTTSGLGPAVSPTRDRAAVRAALRSRGVVGRRDDVTAPFVVTVAEALDFVQGFNLNGSSPNFIKRECSIVDTGPACPELVAASARRLASDTVHRSAMQLRAYAEVMMALRAAPAPRIVIALSTGVAPGAEGDYLGLAPVARAAAEAGVRFYALTEVADGADVSYVGARLLPPQDDRPYARRVENNLLTSGVQTVATAAGGEAWRVVGQADRFFRRVVAETSGVYQLGVEAAAGTLTSRFLDVRVSVKRPGVTVRANRHALAPAGGGAAIAPDAIDASLRTRIAQGGVAFGVPIALATAIRRAPAGTGDVELGVNVQMPAGVVAPLVAMFAVVDSAGKVTSAGRQPVPPAPAGEDYQLAFPIALDAGAYRLRFAVADALGNIGSVEQAVEARLVRFGRVSVSDVVTTWVGPDGRRRLLALETLPAEAGTLRAFLELYPDDPAAPGDLTVRLALVRAGSDAPLEEHAVTPRLDGPALSAGVDLGVGTLPPGSYLIRATVLEAGTVTGTVTTYVRKVGGGGARPF